MLLPQAARPCYPCVLQRGVSNFTPISGVWLKILRERSSGKNRSRPTGYVDSRALGRIAGPCDRAEGCAAALDSTPRRRGFLRLRRARSRFRGRFHRPGRVPAAPPRRDALDSAPAVLGAALFLAAGEAVA